MSRQRKTKENKYQICQNTGFMKRKKGKKDIACLTHTHAHKKEIRLITKNRRLQLPSEDPWRISPVCNKGGAASSSTR